MRRIKTSISPKREIKFVCQVIAYIWRVKREKTSLSFFLFSFAFFLLSREIKRFFHVNFICITSKDFPNNKRKSNFNIYLIKVSAQSQISSRPNQTFELQKGFEKHMLWFEFANCFMNFNAKPLFFVFAHFPTFSFLFNNSSGVILW